MGKMVSGAGYGVHGPHGRGSSTDMATKYAQKTRFCTPKTKNWQLPGHFSCDGCCLWLCFGKFVYKLTAPTGARSALPNTSTSADIIKQSPPMFKLNQKLLEKNKNVRAFGVKGCWKHVQKSDLHSLQYQLFELCVPSFSLLWFGCSAH